MAIVINGSGTITGISAGGLPDGTVTADDLASTLDLSGKTVTLPSGVGGKVLQVVTVEKNTVTSQASGGSSTYYDISGMSLNITPSSTSSKILIFVHASTSNGNGASLNDSIRLVRDSTPISVGTGAGTANVSSFTRLPAASMMYQSALTYLDSPATTSQTTYKLQWALEAGTGYLNRRSGDTSFIASSGITAMEIAG